MEPANSPKFLNLSLVTIERAKKSILPFVTYPSPKFQVSAIIGLCQEPDIFKVLGCNLERNQIMSNGPFKRKGQYMRS